ncbi:cytochrome ubiquinol oxidase subunit I [Alkalihalobacterium chitinilyticum]|uniref:Cytochrome ubiquinol oxidase subunit I n=1 Tax=Alkalihalobacterium chitinilyticum TaxID=2980103 RepID=A0ABT5VIN3_9BACI|nr:cytochrome ubiquinol oxidase subunit I [Alkalihalobacterium chitinilyticum]MDE5415284.1 cytochrome ubiquinol oxidase subunit I [Alkalihalobacterium chitinilyticum]
MDNVLLARMLFGSSMAFHIIFATLGVGITLMILIAEIVRAITKDNDYGLLAKRWTKGVAILLGVAIPSGTIVGVMLSLLWPGFMEMVGQVIALPFQVEIFAFFIEAVFLSIYIYAADRLSSTMRLISVFFVAFGATASAVLITDAHAWMNTPRGFDIVGGQVVNVRPWEAVFNPSIYVTALHVVSTAYLAGAFAIAAVAAYRLLRGGLSDRERMYHRKGMILSLIVAAITSVYTSVNGHDVAVMLHNYLPVKLAAAEGLFETQSNAPLAIFGEPDPEAGRVVGGIEIPGMLSWLATGSTDGVVVGLYDFPEEEWPPLFVHTLFNIMVGIGTMLIGISFLALAYRIFRKDRPFPAWILVPVIAGGPLAMIGIETGWIFSCTARQPWTIHQVMTTADAATQSGNLGMLFFLFITLYVMLLVLTYLVMNFYFKRNPVSKDLEVTP